MVLTLDKVESTWKKLADYERDNFGLKFGPDFATIAAVLRQSKQFMSLGGLTTMLAAMEMSSLSQQMKSATSEDERKIVAEDLLNKPSSIHNTLAEIFYLGYELGKQNAEVASLEQLASIPEDHG